MNIKKLLRETFKAGLCYAIDAEGFEDWEKACDDFLADQRMPNFCFTLPELIDFLEAVGCERVFPNKPV